LWLIVVRLKRRAAEGEQVLCQASAAGTCPIARPSTPPSRHRAAVVVAGMPPGSGLLEASAIARTDDLLPSWRAARASRTATVCQASALRLAGRKRVGRRLRARRVSCPRTRRAAVARRYGVRRSAAGTIRRDPAAASQLVLGAAAPPRSRRRWWGSVGRQPDAAGQPRLDCTPVAGLNSWRQLHRAPHDYADARGAEALPEPGDREGRDGVTRASWPRFPTAACARSCGA